MRMAGTPLRAERAGSSLVLTIDRPDVRNAIDQALAERIGRAVTEAGDDPELRAVVLTGGGDEVFVAGGDLKEFGGLAPDEHGAEHILDMGLALGAIEACPLPVIAALQGDAFGGGAELVVLCDLCVMEEHAGIHFRHAKMGLTPAWGGTCRLIERVGAGRATDLLLTARRVSAAEALAMGLVHRVAGRGGGLAAALGLASEIASSARSSVAAIKASITRARQARRADALEREREVFRLAWGSESHLAAMRAFLQR
jgi:enoyl-CoA hydratase/carnithine racemase